jgi:hypothetical protein
MSPVPNVFPDSNALVSRNTRFTLNRRVFPLLDTSLSTTPYEIYPSASLPQATKRSRFSRPTQEGKRCASLTPSDLQFRLYTGRYLKASILDPLPPRQSSDTGESTFEILEALEMPLLHSAVHRMQQ